MDVGHVRCFLLALGFSLAGCAAEETQLPAETAQARPAPLAPTVVQNLTYTTNVYGPATIYGAGTVSADAAVTAPPPQVTDAPGAAQYVDAGFTATPRRTTLPPDFQRRTKVGPVGIKACDDYIDRIESCSRQIFDRLPGGDSGGAMFRIETSLDMMRRSWRNAELTPKGRATLAENCVDSLRMYESSVAGQCE